MKYLFIASFALLTLSPLCLASPSNDSDLCTITIKQPYQIYSSNNGISKPIGKIYQPGDKITGITSTDIQQTAYKDIQNWGIIVFVGYEKHLAFPVNVLDLVDCHIEETDKAPYYRLVANDLLEQDYQNRYRNLLPQYQIFLSDEGAKAQTKTALNDLVDRKNSLCADDWHFCSNAALLTEANPQIKKECVDAAKQNTLSIKIMNNKNEDNLYLSAFSSSKNNLDRNNGEVTLYDEAHYQGVNALCKYSLEEKRITAFSSY